MVQSYSKSLWLIFFKYGNGNKSLANPAVHITKNGKILYGFLAAQPEGMELCSFIS